LKVFLQVAVLTSAISPSFAVSGLTQTPQQLSVGGLTKDRLQFGTHAEFKCS